MNQLAKSGATKRIFAGPRTPKVAGGVEKCGSQSEEKEVSLWESGAGPVPAKSRKQERQR